MYNERRSDLIGAVLDTSVIIEFTDKLLELDIDESVVLQFVRAFHRQALITDNTYIVNVVIDDPDDNIFLATAMEGQADYLVSLDRHLLSLKYYQGVQIV